MNDTMKEPTWSQPLEALRLFSRGATVRTAVPVALVVGTILALINQGNVLLRGQGTSATWTSVPLDYCVPFLVSSIGYMSARRTSPALVKEDVDALDVTAPRRRQSLRDHR